MAHFVLFDLDVSEDENNIYINPDHVWKIDKYSSTHTKLYINDISASWVGVPGTPSEVVARLTRRPE